MGKPFGYWNIKENVFAEAMKYHTKSEFFKGCVSAYKVALKNGWLLEMTWLIEEKKPNGYWTKESVFNEARKYQTKNEFKKGCSGAYNAALKNSWLSEMFWFVSSQKQRGYWDIKENVFEEARKYSTRSEFCKCCGSAYDAARKHNWLGKMTWFNSKQKPSGYWTKERVFAEAKKYKIKNAFRNGCMSAYLYAYRNKWINEMYWFKDERLDIINDKIDSVYKYYFKETNSIYIGRTLISQQKERKNAHNTSEKDTVFRHAKENGLVVPPMEIIEENITIKEGLEKEDYWKNYYKERGYNVLNLAKTGIGSGSIGAIAKGKWTKNKVFEVAKTCKTRTEFSKKYKGAYVKALNKGWLSEMTWFENGFILMWRKRKCVA